MDGKKNTVIIAVVIVLIAIIVFFVLGFLRRGPIEKPQSSFNDISSKILY